MVDSPRHTLHSSSDNSEPNYEDPLSPIPKSTSDSTGPKLTKELLGKRDSLLVLDEEACLNIR